MSFISGYIRFDKQTKFYNFTTRQYDFHDPYNNYYESSLQMKRKQPSVTIVLAHHSTKNEIKRFNINVLCLISFCTTQTKSPYHQII